MLAHESRYPMLPSPTVTSTVKHIYSQHGWKGFTRGIGLTVARAGPVAASVLPIFDYTFNYLEEMRL
jgi:hypothetical protein